MSLVKIVGFAISLYFSIEAIQLAYFLCREYSSVLATWLKALMFTSAIGWFITAMLGLILAVREAYRSKRKRIDPYSPGTY